MSRTRRSKKISGKSKASVLARLKRVPPPSLAMDERSLLAYLKRNRATTAELAKRYGVKAKEIEKRLDALRAAGHLIYFIDGRWIRDTKPAPGNDRGIKHKIVSSKDDTFLFGVSSDQHLGSKYERLDVLHELYDEFERAGVERVFNSGNWIEGEARFNVHEVNVHGMHAQCHYLACEYPERPGITTYAVAGDDHEGWYCGRDGVDIGLYAETVMREEGRTDWINLGYMESFIPLVNRRSGATSMLAVVHPGGGTAYAMSYQPQKIVECVPLDSEILTQEGWKSHAEVKIGDMTIGWNRLTDQCQWTEVKAIHRGTGDVVRYYNDQFDVRCTRNHRWAMEWESRAGRNPNSTVPVPYSRQDLVLQSIDDSTERCRIIQAAPCPDGPGLGCFEHHDWLRKDQAVLRMTSGERRSFIEGLLVGEGTVCSSVRPSGASRTVVFCQRPGFVNDAFRLACFLEGIATTDNPCPPGRLKPDQEPARRVTMLKKSMRNVSSLKECLVGSQDVWCVTTGLGTWTMRQGALITLTGNSYEGGEKPAVALYGHYHKLGMWNVRNVWALLCGCTQDQTSFMRKKRIDAHIGGAVVELKQDPESGAIVRCRVDFLRYFNRGFYNDRWSKAAAVRLPDRGVRRAA